MLSNYQRVKPGSDVALVSLFISFGNDQLPNLLATDDKVVGTNNRRRRGGKAHLISCEVLGRGYGFCYLFRVSDTSKKLQYDFHMFT